MQNWTPEPLVDDVPENHPALKCKRTVTKISGKYIRIDGFNCLNLGTHNYLGLLNVANIQESAIDSVRRYGVGSCGPKGFYGYFGNDYMKQVMRQVILLVRKCRQVMILI